MLISILLAVIIACVLVVVLMLARGASKKKDKDAVTERIQKKGKSAIMKEIEKKLAHDPHNVQALESLGNIYYEDKNWDKAITIYKTLYDISAAHVEINVAEVAKRLGISLFNQEKYDDALGYLMISTKKNPEDYDCNLYLGRCFYLKDTFDKALYCFKKARLLKPDSMEVVEYVGYSLFKMSKYRDSLPYLKKVLDMHPENKEVLFNMAVAMSECAMQDKALKVFVHLRPDPQFGGQSCLEAGKIHEHAKNYPAAIQDYEIALKLQGVPEQLLLQIKYRLASMYIAINDISKGLSVLKQIQAVKSNYKDVDTLVTRYSELNQNKNLQTFLLAGTSDFIAMCRKFIHVYYPDGVVKVEDVQVQSECVEIIADIQSSKTEAKEIFRFYRTQTVIGDIYVREFHGKIRDAKCDLGLCITMGSFSEGAHKYTEGRPIDLVEKDELLKILKKISMFG